MKKLAWLFALFMSCSSLGFAAETPEKSYDGSDDVIEAWGGTRNGGDC